MDSQTTIIKLVKAVTGKWRKKCEARERSARAWERQEREWERQERATKLPLTLAVPLVLEEAVEHATGGLYPVSAHTLFYSVRPRVQPIARKQLEPGYFEQDLLPAYQREHGPILLPDGRPAIYYEPRGTLYEPHSGKEVPLGTREVEAYAFPAWLYDKILFVEKQGLWPVLKAARLAERYDMAIVAGEGYATEACRVLFANADRGMNYQLFVLHDADPYGYNIARTLRDETQRMPGYRVQVIDLGLRLKDALDRGLTPEHFLRKKAIPQALRLTRLEESYFVGVQKASGDKPSWLCRRVELNALAAPDFIAYIEQQLRAYGVRGKVLPPDEYLARHLQEVHTKLLKETVERSVRRLLDLDAVSADVAKGFGCTLSPARARKAVRDAFGQDPMQSWRGVVGERLGAVLTEGARADRLDRAVRAALQEQLARLDEDQTGEGR